MGNELHPSQEALLRFFEYDHLSEHLQRVSKPFADLAGEIRAAIIRGDMASDGEATTALRKLLEAKDCAVRAALGAR